MLCSTSSRPLNTFGSRTQALSARQKGYIQRSSPSINHPFLITPPLGINPFPLPRGSSSCDTSSSGVRRVEPDDAEEHKSAVCGSAGHRHRRSAGRSYRHRNSWSASTLPQSPIPLPTSNPPCDLFICSTPGQRDWGKEEKLKKRAFQKQFRNENALRAAAAGIFSFH